MLTLSTSCPVTYSDGVFVANGIATSKPGCAARKVGPTFGELVNLPCFLCRSGLVISISIDAVRRFFYTANLAAPSRPMVVSSLCFWRFFAQSVWACLFARRRRDELHTSSGGLTFVLADVIEEPLQVVTSRAGEIVARLADVSLDFIGFHSLEWLSRGRAGFSRASLAIKSQWEEIRRVLL